MRTIQILAVVVKETDKALQVDTEQQRVWLPKSQIVANEAVRAGSNERLLTIPSWLAANNNIVAHYLPAQQPAPKANPLKGFTRYEEDGYVAYYRNYSQQYGCYRIGEITAPDGREIYESFDRRIVGTERRYNHGSTPAQVIRVIQGAIAWDKLSEQDREEYRTERLKDRESGQLF